MARAEPAMVDIHGAVWSSPDSYELVPSAERYEVYEMSFAAKVRLCVMYTHTDFQTNLGSLSPQCSA